MVSENTGKKLLDEILGNKIKLYNGTHVNNLRSEMEELDHKMRLLKEDAEKHGIREELSINFSLLKSFKDRNERILKTYLFQRLLKITENFFLKENIFDMLSANELVFNQEFTDITETYLDKYRHLDLVDREPPLDFYVQIITLADCGTILNGDEFIDLKKNRLYYVKKSDIAHIINAKLVNIL